MGSINSSFYRLVFVERSHKIKNDQLLIAIAVNFAAINIFALLFLSQTRVDANTRWHYLSTKENIHPGISMINSVPSPMTEFKLNLPL
ncbi:hypothetical protein GTQ43_21210 [Nostoc sp. KVJ3]|uniref:hypothetical protein n=1 Tax=Nostoc sp. KVJ3 TaxID=457945 RepID=UPI0022380B18|nr:hypothetical protein [Nostoc sp. KVJ3]MCW5316241.1 hypothetical protein [Nostoc sp. KVJ3]